MATPPARAGPYRSEQLRPADGRPPRGAPQRRLPVPEANEQDRINAVKILRDLMGRSRFEVAPTRWRPSRTRAGRHGQARQDQKTTNKKDPYFRRTSWSGSATWRATGSLRGTASRRQSATNPQRRMKQPGYAFGDNHRG
jgi:hypothetical protein